LSLLALLVGITNKNKTSNRGEEEEDNKRMHSTAGFGLALLAFFQIALAIMTTAGPSTINRHSQGDIFSHQGFSLFLLHISDIRWYSEDDGSFVTHRCTGAAGECNAAACLSALGQRNNGSLSAARLGRHCQCQCPMDRPIYREDLKQCVSTIDGKLLLFFSSSSSALFF
jgi:hypothetical protein